MCFALCFYSVKPANGLLIVDCWLLIVGYWGGDGRGPLGEVAVVEFWTTDVG